MRAVEKEALSTRGGGWERRVAVVGALLVVCVVSLWFVLGAGGPSPSQLSASDSSLSGEPVQQSAGSGDHRSALGDGSSGIDEAADTKSERHAVPEAQSDADAFVGRVVDSVGRPLAGASVCLRSQPSRSIFGAGREPPVTQWLPRMTSLVAQREQNVPPVDHRSAKEHVVCRLVPSVAGAGAMPGDRVVTADVEGRFRIERPPGASLGRFEIAADLDGYWSQSAIASEGSDPLLFRLERRRRVVGSLLLPDGMHPLDIHILVRRGRERFQAEEKLRGPQLCFSVPVLGAEPVDVSVELKGWPDPLVEASGVLPLEGRGSFDPRLQSVDLRSRIHQYRVTLRHADGRPFGKRDAKFMLREAGADASVWVVWADPGDEIVAPVGRLDVAWTGVAVRGGQRRLAPGAHEIELAAIDSVEVRVDGVRALRSAEVLRVQLSARFEAGAGDPFASHLAMLPLRPWLLERNRGPAGSLLAGCVDLARVSMESESATLRLSRPGRYRLRLQRVRMGFSTGTDPVDIGVLELAADAGGGPHRPRVRLDREALAAAMR